MLRSMKSRVRVVDDDPALAEMLTIVLRGEGFDTAVVGDGTRALPAVRELRPDVVLLDLMLPDIPGTEVCRRIRGGEVGARQPAVMMLTAKGEEIDRVVGFEVGADDYVVKPYSVRELVLRIRAQLRHRAQRAEGEPTLLRFGRLEIDRDAHRAWVDKVEVTLTALEFKLLYAFMSRRGRVQSRDALLSDVWGIDADVTTRTVDTHVKRLREKLGPAGDYIETVRGVGYRFVPRPADDGS